MKNYFSSDFRLGVLGGGQLGRMLLTETQKYDIFTVILDGDEHAPLQRSVMSFIMAALWTFKLFMILENKLMYLP